LSEHKSAYVTGGEVKQPLIRNCRFAFRCHQQWQSLEETADPSVRYCHECSRQVVLCRRNADLRAALQANECVALINAETDRLTHTIGVLSPEGFARRLSAVKKEPLHD
jgi:hypothetical protein